MTGSGNPLRDIIENSFLSNLISIMSEEITANIQEKINSIQEDIASILDDKWIVLSAGSGTGTGSAQTITATGNKIIITNTGVHSLTLAVGAISLVVNSGQTLPLPFTEFSSFNITATSGESYSYIVGG